MCFSPSASFTASAALALIGSKAVSKNRNPAFAYFAAIPLIFSIQQAAEGVVWLSLQYDSLAQLKIPATYVYLFFAFVLWPCWIPFSVRQLAQTDLQKKILSALLLLGATVAATLLYYICYFGAQAQIESCHILYTYQIPEQLTFWGSIGYLIATIVSFFVTHNKKMYLVGAALALAYAVSYYAYTVHLVSVWCFFAALISLAVVWAEQ